MVTQTMPKTGVKANESIQWRKAMLAAGIASGPFFYIVALVQMFIRPGFDIRRHAISTLSLGDLGWIQIANFIITGLLAILCAIGLQRLLHGGKAGTWGPLFIGAYGVGLVIGGIFHPDPGLGFPPGAPAAVPTTMSPGATVHTLAFFLAFLSLIIACFVFVRRFASMREWGWAIYCAATGVIAPVLIILGSSNPSMVGLIIAIAGAIAFGWVSVIAAHFLSEL